MDNVSLLAEDSHGKKKLGERREISAGLRRVLSFSRRPYLWSKPTGQLFERTRSVASVKQNRVLSHFQFAQNTFYRELFHESI